MTDPMFDLTGKIALITGGSRGLGLQMVRAFAARGADVVIASRKLDACEAAAAEVQAMGRRAMAVSVNMSRWEDAERLVETVYAAWGRVDILVNNAGMGPRVASHDYAEALFDKVMDLNFKGPFRLGALVSKRMFDGAGGTIINVSSSGALYPLPEVVPYSGAKAALNAMTVSFAREYAPKVRVNSICPGPILKPPTGYEETWESLRKTNPQHEIGSPQQIIEAILFLLTGPTFVNGVCLRVDGGTYWYRPNVH